MRRTALLLVLLLGTLPVFAEEDPPKPLTTGQAASEVLEAFEAKDDAALKALAEKDVPDPWLVVDELCFRGEHDAAEAFAKAAPRKTVERLPDYATSRRGKEPEETARRALAAMSAALARDPQAALAIADTVAGPATPVIRIRIAMRRGLALRALRRLAQSAAAFRRAAVAASELGWLRCAASAHSAAGRSARQDSDWRAALAAWAQCLALYEELGNRAAVAKTLGNIGNLHARLGAHVKALSFQERALALSEELGNRAGVAAALGNIGLIHCHLGAYPKALSHQERALTLMKELGNQAGVAITLGNIGNIHEDLGAYPKALSYQEHALALMEELGNRAGEAYTLGSIGNIHTCLGAYAKALSFQERALALWEGLGDRAGAARALGNIGNICDALGEYAKALTYQERSLALREELGDRAGVAHTLGNIGNIHYGLGEYPKALSYQERSLALADELGDRAGVAHMLGNIGLTQYGLGEYPKALSHQARALALSEELGDRAGVARTLGNIGIIHMSLGERAKALSYQERALALKEEIGDQAGVALTLVNIGNIHYDLHEHAKALSCYERSLTLMEESGNRAGVAKTLGNIGNVYYLAGEYPKALSYQERALALKEEIGDRAGVASTLGHIGLVHEGLGAHPKALSYLGRAVREARRLRVRRILVEHLSNRARVFLANGKAGRALAASQKALMEVEGLLGGLGEEEGASARERFADLFAGGTLAAARLDEPAEALTFLESGRAGALLETLGSRRALCWADLPEELRRAEAEAKAKESRARYDYGRALDGGNFREIRKAAKALDETTGRIREVSARIQREAKRQASLFYPRAATLEEIEGWLGADEALVLYGLCRDEALALVLTRDGERIVPLGTVDAVREACEALRVQERNVDSRDALEHLRALLVEPLALPDTAKRVLISPEGPLCYVPFGALFDRPVACTPSGSTHALLMEEERQSGEQVLALGDPDYGLDPDPGAVEIYRGGARLLPLPGTRLEAASIGDVTLLGTDACEERLAETIATQKRWRAVHLACHGLVDPERPTLSSLALTRSGKEDGFLTALEVLRMEIPADLVVLSACETGKGKIVKGEGIVGLMRMFMYAGAPRVICSLWKVDDEATRALMVKFYELWNPGPALSDPGESNGKREGMGTAAALEKAQEFVRSHEKWKHPYYWAAWVLWGLPD